MTGIVATAETTVRAKPERVWAALTEPDQIAAYMGGSRVETTWQVGSSITWSGHYDGHSYQDRGEVLRYEKPHLLSVTHYSPLMGLDDRPENYHTLVYTLHGEGDLTHLSLTQDGCTDQDQARQFGRNWQQMLEGLAAYVQG